MGQYHKVVNATDNLYFDGRDLSTGVKLLEMGNSLTPTAALITLLAGEWNDTRTFLIGDYAGNDDVVGIDNASSLYGNLEENGYSRCDELAREAAHRATGVDFTSSQEHFPKDTAFTEGANHLRSVENSVTAALDSAKVLAFVNYDTKEKYVPGDTMREAIENFDSGFGTVVFVMLAGSIRGGARGGGDSNASYGGIWAGNRVGIITDSEAGVLRTSLIPLVGMNLNHRQMGLAHNSM